MLKDHHETNPKLKCENPRPSLKILQEFCVKLASRSLTSKLVYVSTLIIDFNTSKPLICLPFARTESGGLKGNFLLPLRDYFSIARLNKQNLFIAKIYLFSTSCWIQLRLTNFFFSKSYHRDLLHSMHDVTCQTDNFGLNRWRLYFARLLISKNNPALIQIKDYLKNRQSNVLWFNNLTTKMILFIYYW
jgi:hypothetical protein